MLCMRDGVGSIVVGVLGVAIALVGLACAGACNADRGEGDCGARLAQETDAPAPTAPAPPSNPQGVIDEQRLLATLRALPTKRSPNADRAHADGLLETEALLVRELRAMGIEPRLEPVRWAPPIRPSVENQRPEPREWNNVIVEFPGTGSAIDLGIGGNNPMNGIEYREVIVLGAHFDAVPMAPGADDNGSGAAALLEMVRAFKVLHNAAWTHDTTIRCVFFNLEEVGLVGSKHHVAQWMLLNRKAIEATKGAASTRAGNFGQPPAERLTLMLSLECIGFFSDEPGSQKSPFKAIPGVFEPPTVGDTIALVTLAKHQVVSKELGAAMARAAPALKIFRADFSPLPLPDLMRSDHAPFMFIGVPSFMVTDTANFRNPNYHKPTDTVETLDLARLTLVTRGIAGAIWEMSVPTPPKAAPAK